MSVWQRNIVEPGKLPLLILFVAFIATWLVTRTVTRSIRAGRGPLHNLSAGGVHLHHSVPGIILLTAGAVGAIGLPARAPWREAAGAVVGIGASLVFDEFAMILHLDDDYWTAEGQQSVEAVGLVTACLALSLAGFVPFGINDVNATELTFRYLTVAAALVTFTAVVVCAMKGKFRLGLIAVFLWPVALVGAVRLARPSSRWDRRCYRHSPAKRARSEARETAFNRRWDPRWRQLADALGGRPGPSASL